MLASRNYFEELEALPLIVDGLPDRKPCPVREHIAYELKASKAVGYCFKHSAVANFCSQICQHFHGKAFYDAVSYASKNAWSAIATNLLLAGMVLYDDYSKGPAGLAETFAAEYP